MDTLGILVERGFNILADIIATTIHIIESHQNTVIYPVKETVHFGDVVAVFWSCKAHFPICSYSPSKLAARAFLNSGMVIFLSSYTSFFTAIKELAASTLPTQIWATV